MKSNAVTHRPNADPIHLLSVNEVSIEESPPSPNADLGFSVPIVNNRKS